MPAMQDAVKKLFGKEPAPGHQSGRGRRGGRQRSGRNLRGTSRGEVKDMLLLDVTPLSLSIETMGGVATPMIPKNTTVPTSKSQIFSTASDNQTSVEIKVPRANVMAADNKTLARFILDGFRRRQRGLPRG